MSTYLGTCRSGAPTSTPTFATASTSWVGINKKEGKEDSEEENSSDTYLSGSLESMTVTKPEDDTTWVVLYFFLYILAHLVLVLCFSY